MPRYRRLFLPDVPVHIVHRGHDRQPVFFQPADFACYLGNLVDAKQRYKVRVHAFCLMTNHVHLLATPGKQADGVSAMMRVIAARQTRRINRIGGRSGTLWEGRFKASLVDSSAYLLACYRYIELNPVRAAIVRRPGSYRWSSYRHNAGNANLGWLDTHAEFELLGESAGQRHEAYRALVKQGVSDEERRTIRTALNRSQVTGGDPFRRALERSTGRRLSAAGPGRPPRANK